MYSSSLPAFPVGGISYAADRAITNPADILVHLHGFSKVQSTDMPGGERTDPHTVYLLELPPPDNSKTRLFKWSIGLLEISLAYDSSTDAAQMQIFLNAPIVGSAQVGSMTGSLTDGTSIKFGYGSILSGAVGSRLKDRDAYITYSFTAFGKSYGGETKFLSV